LQASAITYMDKLKSCSPYTYSYPHPFFKTFTGKNIIKGKQQKGCAVDYLLPNHLTMRCVYSPETIRLLTSNQKYQEVKTGRFHGSTSSPESKAMAKECVTGKGVPDG